jgi:hypothetical protein
MSLSKPFGSRPIRKAVTAPPPARRQGQSNRPDVKQPSDRFELQGSNIFDGLLKQNDQGRSLTCVHHEGCLRSLVRRRSDPKVRRTTTWIAKTASVHRNVLAHILAAVRLFTCQRAPIFHADKHFRVHRLQPYPSVARTGEAECYRRLALCQSGVARIFTRRSRSPNRAFSNRWTPFIGNGRQKTFARTQPGGSKRSVTWRLLKQQTALGSLERRS